MLPSSCALHSTTTIKSNEQFLLGNNPHRTFRVRLKNLSAGEIKIHRAPISGGRHSGHTISAWRKCACSCGGKHGLGHHQQNTCGYFIGITGERRQRVVVGLYQELIKNCQTARCFNNISAEIRLFSPKGYPVGCKAPINLSGFKWSIRICFDV